MSKITRDMVTVLNLELKEKGCCFRYMYNEEGFSGNPHIEIIPASTEFLSSHILNLSDVGFSFVRNFFKERGIELGTNNDRSIMWSLTGWGSVTKSATCDEFATKLFQLIERKTVNCVYDFTLDDLHNIAADIEHCKETLSADLESL